MTSAGIWRARRCNFTGSFKALVFLPMQVSVERYTCWAAPTFDHVLADARLGDLKPELEQFAVNAWRVPQRIFDAHPPDQRAQIRFDLRSPSTARSGRKLALCQRTSVLGRMMMSPRRIDGNQRSSRIKDQRYGPRLATLQR
jgi:hypothetical protein